MASQHSLIGELQAIGRSWQEVKVDSYLGMMPKADIWPVGHKMTYRHVSSKDL